MKKNITRIIVFVVSVPTIIILIAILTSTLVMSRGFKIYQTDSNTLVMGRNKHYDYLLTGASHARNLSRHQNHIRVEKIIGKSFSNIAQGAATCGINEQFFYFKYFYEEKNSVDNLLFMLSPPLLYSEELPVASNTFNEETFSFRFINSYLKFDSENKRQRLFEYIKSKLTYKWITLQPRQDTSNSIVLEKMDTLTVRNIIDVFYRNNTSPERFGKSCKRIEEEVLFAKEHGTKVIFIIPPAVFGRWPGHDETLAFAKSMREKYGCRYYDLSETIRDPKYYYDHHHLNTAGVVLFTEKFLKPCLEDSTYLNK